MRPQVGTSGVSKVCRAWGAWGARSRGRSDPNLTADFPGGSLRWVCLGGREAFDDKSGGSPAIRAPCERWFFAAMSVVAKAPRCGLLLADTGSDPPWQPRLQDILETDGRPAVDESKRAGWVSASCWVAGCATDPGTAFPPGSGAASTARPRPTHSAPPNAVVPDNRAFVPQTPWLSQIVILETPQLQ